MKEIYYIYNNEAIASCIFLSILNRTNKLDISRACLILPFLLDDRTVNYLAKNQNKNRTLKQLIKEQPQLFISFNKRYISLLPISVNSLMILSKGNLITITNEIVKSDNSSFENKDLGIRFYKIEKILPDFVSMFEKYSTSKLYKVLKIQL